MVSLKYLPAVVLLLALALPPTIIHSYANHVVVDGRSTAAIPATIAEFRASETTRNANWGQRAFQSSDWIDRNYVSVKDEVRLTVVRSYDPKSIYHHPELLIAYGTTFTRAEDLRLPSHPEVPLKVLRGLPGVTATAIYALHYGDGFVENPILFQIRLAGELLVNRRQPMTLFFAFQRSNFNDSAPEQFPATRVLFPAIDAFLAQAPPLSSNSR